jgi:hypothetical protein
MRDVIKAERKRKRLEVLAQERWNKRMDDLEARMRSWTLRIAAEAKERPDLADPNWPDGIMSYWRKNDWHSLATSDRVAVVVRPDYQARQTLSETLANGAATCHDYPMVFAIMVSVTIEDGGEHPDLNAELASARIIQDKLRPVVEDWRESNAR